MTSRYTLRQIKKNSHKLYKSLRKSRGVRVINHYVPPKFFPITDEEEDEIEYHMVYWRIGSKFHKLAEEYYGDPTLWWVIAFYNKKPTDFHVKIGEMIFIPKQWEIPYNAVVEPDDRFE